MLHKPEEILNMKNPYYEFPQTKLIRFEPVNIHSHSVLYFGVLYFPPIR
jgi:hypothetical protein